MATDNTVTPLAALTKDMRRQTIIARIIKLWTAYHPTTEKKYSYDFVMVDHENTAIEGFIRIDDPDAKTILQQLQEGSIYKIYKFRSENKRETFKTVDHKIRILLTGATDITKIENDDPTIPLYYFDFKPLRSIGTTIKEPKTVVDVIGQVISIGALKKIQQNNRSVSIRELEIQDERDDKVQVTIWEDYLSEINVKKMQEESQTQHIILAFSSLLLSTFSEKYNLKTYSGTRIYQERSLPPIADFQKRIAQKPPQLTLHEVATPEEQSSQSSSDPISVAELVKMSTPENQSKQFNVVAEIEEVVEELGWYYLACPLDKTRLRQAEANYKCVRCKTYVEKPQAWYNFCLTVTDGIEKADFVFIGKSAEYLLHCTAQDLLTEPKPEKQYLPTKFLDLIHKKYLFTVRFGNNKFQKETTNYQVIKIAPVPPTTTTQQPTPSTPKIISPHAPTTPVENFSKNSSESQLKRTATIDIKDTRKQLFPEHLSKKPKTSGYCSKGKEKEKDE